MPGVAGPPGALPGSDARACGFDRLVPFSCHGRALANHLLAIGAGGMTSYRGLVTRFLIEMAGTAEVTKEQFGSSAWAHAFSRSRRVLAAEAASY